MDSEERLFAAIKAKEEKYELETTLILVTKIGEISALDERLIYFLNDEFQDT